MDKDKTSLNVKQWLKQDKPSKYLKLLVFRQFYKNIVKQVQNKKVVKAIRSQIKIEKDFKLIFPSSAIVKEAGSQSQLEQGIIYKLIQDPIQIALNFLILLISQPKIINAADYCNSRKYFMNNRQDTFIKQSFELKGRKTVYKQYQQQISKLISYYEKQIVAQQNLRTQTQLQTLTSSQSQLRNPIKNNSQQNQILEYVNDYLKQNKFNDALKRLESQKSKHWIISNAKGVINQHLKKYKQAEFYYQQAYQQNKSELIKYNLCSLFYANNELLRFNDNLLELKNMTKVDYYKIIIDEFLAEGLLKAKQYQKSQNIFLSLESKTQDMLKKIHYQMKIIQILLHSSEYTKAKNKIQSLKATINNQIKSAQQVMSNSSAYRINQLSQTSVDNNTKILLNYKQINDINYILLNKLINNQYNPLNEIHQLYLTNLHSPLINKMYAQSLLENGQFQKSHKIYLDCYSNFRNDFEFHWNLATCSFELESIQCFQNLNECKRIQPERSKQINNTMRKIKKHFQDKGLMKKIQKTIPKQYIQKINLIIHKAIQQQ